MPVNGSPLSAVGAAHTTPTLRVRSKAPAVGAGGASGTSGRVVIVRGLEGPDHAVVKPWTVKAYVSPGVRPPTVVVRASPAYCTRDSPSHAIDLVMSAYGVVHSVTL